MEAVQPICAKLSFQPPPKHPLTFRRQCGLSILPKDTTTDWGRAGLDNPLYLLSHNSIVKLMFLDIFCRVIYLSLKVRCQFCLRTMPWYHLGTPVPNDIVPEKADNHSTHPVSLIVGLKPQEECDWQPQPRVKK